MKPWRAVYAHNGGVEAMVADSHHFDKKKDTDPDPDLH